ncbi:MAG: class I mannose-6-phosphate isomerase [Bryobacteraceae bacterium]
MKLTPSFRERVWGSTSLEPWFDRRADPQHKIGEVWFERDPPLPILVKFLFTTGNLSVQVHPEGEAGTGKTEMWYILAAEPGAKLALGFRRVVTRNEVARAATEGTVESLLQFFPVKPGETYFVPAGTVHAIGAGIVLCEIQQNSDITYRLYDYGRGRELHLEQGLAVADLDGHPGAPVPKPGGDDSTRLVESRYFVTELIEASEPRRIRRAGESCLLMAVEGDAAVDGDPFRAGEVILLERDSVELQLRSRVRLLRTFLP